MFRFCLCGDPKPLNSCCQASTDRSGHSGDLVIHSCPKALLEPTLNFPQNITFGQVSTYICDLWPENQSPHSVNQSQDNSDLVIKYYLVLVVQNLNSRHLTKYKVIIIV